MKQYEKTHPWITFQVDLRDVPYSLWMKLGKCASKIEHVSRVPLVHDSAEDLYKIYLAKGVHATRAEYARQLARTSQSGGDVVPFLAYAVQGFLDGLHGQLEMISEQHLNIIWQHHIYQRFPRQETVAGKRRRDLLLELSAGDQAIDPLSSMMTSDRLSESYKEKPWTITKDLQWLTDKSWITKEENRYFANKETMLKLRPFRVPSRRNSR